MSVEQNRKIAVAALEENHRGYKQIKGGLSDGCEGRCADGLLMESFHLDLNGISYSKLDAILDFNSSVIYRMNDHQGMSFKDIAEALKVRWGL
jgi:hypothetical protein